MRGSFPLRRRSFSLRFAVAAFVASASALSSSAAPELFPRTGHAWPYSSGPHYGDVDRSIERRPGVLHTAVGSFDLLAGRLDLPHQLEAGREFGAAPFRYWVASLDPAALEPQATTAWIEDLRARGCPVVQEMPIAALLLRLTPECFVEMLEHPALLALEPYHPAFKLSPEIGRTPLPDAAAAVSDVYDLEVLLFPEEDAGVASSSIAALGAEILGAQPGLLRVRLQRDRLAALARIEAVRLVFEHVPAYTLGSETGSAIQVGSVLDGARPYHDVGVRGDGAGYATPQVLMVLDDGVSPDAGDLSHSSTVVWNVGPDQRKFASTTLLTTTPFPPGAGDLLSCDLEASDLGTHGHVVSAIAVGNATDVEPAYGAGWSAPGGRALDGVAPRAKLVFFDAFAGVCDDDPMQASLAVGTLYNQVGPAGSMYDAYTAYGARTVNFSWSTLLVGYQLHSFQTDGFLFDFRAAAVIVAAGNEGSVAGAVRTPATAKNAIVVGASYGPAVEGGADPSDRWPNSSVGPAAARIAPILMAPGADSDTAEPREPFACRSSDNDFNAPVECLLAQGRAGTSFAAAAASGAALLVRDYFAQGFHPDGTSSNVGNALDLVPSISGSLVRAVLIASAEWMDGDNLTVPYRFNNEQGYGRIQLDNALPLPSWAPSPLGLLVVDGGTDGGVSDLPLSGLAGPGTSQSASFEVVDPAQELRVALAWTEGVGPVLISDLDLELQAPSGQVYWGNFFTASQGPWSPPTDAASTRDTANVHEAVFLSPALGQVETGTWTVTVRAGALVLPQRYAVAIVGGVTLGSGARLDRSHYSCNGEPVLTIYESNDALDPAPGLMPAEISSRTRVQVLDSTGAVVDEENGVDFSQPVPGVLRFDSETLPLMPAAPGFQVPGDGFLEVRDGDTLKAVYDDEIDGSPDFNRRREASARIDCRPALAATEATIVGGCERDGFGRNVGDAFLDAGESVIYRVTVRSWEEAILENVEATLSCVLPDGDSPVDCVRPEDGCADPYRLNNAPCPYVTILESVSVPLLPSGASVTLDFPVSMAPLIVTTTGEMLVHLRATTSGMVEEGMVLARRESFDLDAGVPPLPDAWDCATSGACAVVGLSPGGYEGSSILSVDVIELSPYGLPVPWNDCDGNGLYTDFVDDTDCNDNAIHDVILTLFADGEPLGERVVLDRAAPGGVLYAGTIPLSSAVDVPGTLFLRKNGTADTPSWIRAVYADRDDGTGTACTRYSNALQTGLVMAESEVHATSELVVVDLVGLVDRPYGDDDGIADTLENVEARVRVMNKTNRDLENVWARLTLASGETDVDCVLRDTIPVGSLPAGSTVVPDTLFSIRIADVQRSSLGEDLSAHFFVTVSGDDFDLTSREQELITDLDLDITGGSAPVTFLESFEAGSGLGTFTSATLDVGPTAVGFRCQYTNPATPTPRYNDPSCNTFLPAGNANDWHLHATTAPDGGRAHTGIRSLHFGDHSSADDSTRLAQLDAARLTNPIALDYRTVPELSFAQQVSFVDDRTFAEISAGETLDRGAVQVQVADAAGNPIGPWETIEPYYNLYDALPTDDVGVVERCAFDPQDDASGDCAQFGGGDLCLAPRDPFEAFGPSSTCAPRFVTGYQGNTDWVAFSASDTGRATDGPGLPGSWGPGTWIETKFNLLRYRGRRVRIRFLTSTAKNQAQVLHAPIDVPLFDPRDDGWYIDDVQITSTLAAPATVVVDTKLPVPAPDSCNPPCTSVIAALSATPPTLAAPGRRLALDAAASTADRCTYGTLQYRFWRDVDRDQVLESSDIVLRDWTDDPTLATTTIADSLFAVEVRCSAAPAPCTGTAFASVSVLRPGVGEVPNGADVAGTPLKLTKQGTSVLLTWGSSCIGSDSDYAVYQGMVGSWTSYTPATCSTAGATSWSIPPAPGSRYFLVVANDTTFEGSYGRGSSGVERSPSASACFEQVIAECP